MYVEAQNVSTVFKILCPGEACEITLLECHLAGSRTKSSLACTELFFFLSVPEKSSIKQESQGAETVGVTVDLMYGNVSDILAL